MSVVRYERQGAVGIILVDSPPVNALSKDVRAGLVACLEQGLADAQAKALVLAGGGRTFIAGADIREFGQPLAQPDLHEVIRRYEEASKPVVAAIHGTALGGGLETAFGCHYRVAVKSAVVGLPEVKLGILPGAGGTQRLPRLAGAEAAIQMITTGEFVPAARARDLGIVDEIVDDLLPGAIAFAERIVAEGKPLRRIRDLAGPAHDPALFEAARKRQPGNLHAPQRCIDAVEAAATLPIDEGMRRERELFQQCMDHPQRRALIHVFFAEREASKIPDVPSDTPVRPIRSAAVLGAGTMGGGIAMNFANAGIPVVVVEQAQDALDRGLGTIRKNYAGTVSKGRLSQADMDKRMGLIRGSLDFADVADVDIVVEAVFEEMDIKLDVFRRLDATAKAGAILATNTSTLDIDRIAAATKRPADVIGTHFFSPANVMKLLEVVRGRQSAKDVIATAMKLGKTLSKVAVLAGNCDGFIGNRMLKPYITQAEFLLEEGASPAQVDRVLVEYGMAMGPFAMSDLAGVDVGWRIAKRRDAEIGPTNRRRPQITDRIAERGRYGQKTGAGFYRYEPGNRTPLPDPEVDEIIKAEAARVGVRRREIGDEEILKRCLYALINEGARILEEGIAIRASDIDITYIYGYGFPAWRGGPMFWADEVGLAQIQADIDRFRGQQPTEWEPAPLLERLAQAGKGFKDL
ncbi:MAG TPA: 3-hydroxyacyl-CoA dehydrogenase NAD-binding domain-containing protein [Azospirillaceae bacterium]|nr:3-hydroxyacyl-CoA dehydrogenase NAD-binding domain-containing protein [Azospirillaceae bacterium]